MAVHPRPAALAQRMSAAPAGRHGRMRDGEYGAAGPQVPPSRAWWAPGASSSSSSSSQQQQPAGLRDTREGGERGARGRSRPGGSRRADRAPREGRTPSPQPRRGRGGAGCCQGARCCCCQGHAHVTLGWRRALVRLRRARGGRAARSRARRARPHSPGGVADLGGCRGRAGSGGQMHDRRSQSKARSASIWGGSLRCLPRLFGGGAKG